MHELGVLKYALKSVSSIALENNIKKIKFITLEIGTESSFVPLFFEKLFPIAVEDYPLFKETKLKIELSPGKELIIKEIGY